MDHLISSLRIKEDDVGHDIFDLKAMVITMMMMCAKDLIDMTKIVLTSAADFSVDGSRDFAQPLEGAQAKSHLSC